MGPATGGARGALGACGRKQRAEAADTSSSAMNDGQLISEQPILSLSLFFFIGTQQSRFFKFPNIIFSRKEQFSVEVCSLRVHKFIPAC